LPPDPKLDVHPIAVVTFQGARQDHHEVADCYCLEDGRPGIDPEVAVRLMIAGLLSGIVQDCELMREVQVNVAIRW
jgi:transposase